MGRDPSLKSVALEQWFPTGEARTPGGAKHHFRGSEMRFSRVRDFYGIVGCTFLQNNQDL